MPKLLKKIFRKFGTKTVRVHGAVFRDMTKAPADINLFLDELLPLVQSGKLSNEEWDKKNVEFFGENPKLVFVGLAVLNKATGKFELINPVNGESCGLPLSGDRIFPVEDVEAGLQSGAMQRVS
jgi:hypothetical protein